MVRIFNKHKHAQQMMLACTDDQSALSESSELCGYIVNEVFKYIAEDRKKSLTLISQMPSQPVKIKSVKKMAEKIAKKMKRRESVQQSQSMMNAEILFGKEQIQVKEDEDMENVKEKKLRGKYNKIPSQKQELRGERTRKREAKRIAKEEAAETLKPSCEKKYNPWTEEEHKLFVEAVRKYGKNWQDIAEYVGTRMRNQIQSHAGVFMKQVKVNPDLPDADIVDILSVNKSKTK